MVYFSFGLLVKIKCVIIARQVRHDKLKILNNRYQEQNSKTYKTKHFNDNTDMVYKLKDYNFIYTNL